MKRLLVISDIHGENDKLNILLNLASYNPLTDQLILLGDYTDRGLYSKQVIENIIRLKKLGAILLKGNHDEMFVRGVKSNLSDANIWLHHGGMECLESYGVQLTNIVDVARQLKQKEFSKIFDTHAKFLDSLPMYYEYDNYIFAHAGIDVDTPLQLSNNRMLLWGDNWNKFFNEYNGDKTVIFGHVKALSMHNSNEVYFGKNNIIGIDGGSVFKNGQLHCLELPSRNVYSI